MTLIPSELPAGLEGDPEVYEAIKRLALATIDHATDLLENAAPSIQLQMVRLLLPSLTKSLNTQRGDANEELKSAVEDMYASMRRTLGAPE